MDEIIATIPWPLWFVGWSWKEAQDGRDWSGLCLGWPSGGKGEFRDAKRLAGNTKIHFPPLCQISSVNLWSWCGWWWDLSRLLLERDDHHVWSESKFYFCWKLWTDAMRECASSLVTESIWTQRVVNIEQMMEFPPQQDSVTQGIWSSSQAQQVTGPGWEQTLKLPITFFRNELRWWFGRIDTTLKLKVIIYRIKSVSAILDVF